MKNLNTFLQVCIYISISLIIFTLAINFVSALDIFQTEIEVGIISSGSSDEVFADIANLPGGLDAIWAIVLTISGILSVGAAILMHSAIPVGAYIFSAVFWTSYLRCITILNFPIGEGMTLFATDPMSSFLTMISVGVLFIWGAALTGIFTGSG